MSIQVAVIIPALNEEAAIAHVIKEIPSLATRVIVVDNSSTDETARRARAAGALVVHEAKKGYGYACLRGLREVGDANVIVFLDGDHSDYPAEMHRLLAPIERGEADLVIGSRTRGQRERGALLPHALLANMGLSFALGLMYGLKVTDIGPFRAILRDKLETLDMQEGTFGWTLEMMIKAANQNLRIVEVPVSYRKRIGHSKVSGSLCESLKAGVKMTQTTLRYLR